MNANIQWLQGTVAPQSRAQMPGEGLKNSYDKYKSFTQNWTEYDSVEGSEVLMRVLSTYRKTYEETLAKTAQVMPPTPEIKTAKPKPPKKSTKAGSDKPAPSEKAADTPKFKKGDYIELAIKGAYGIVNALTADGYEVHFATSDSSIVLWDEQIQKATKTAFEKQKKSFAPVQKAALKPAETEAKPKPEKKKPATQKTASDKPKAEKKPSAAEKQLEKGQQTLQELKAENREFEKKIIFDADFLTTMTKLIKKHEQSAKGLGALPAPLSNDIKNERALNTLYKRVMKRNVKSFKALEKKVKKSNELSPKLEQQFYSLYGSLSGLKLSAVANHTVKPKRKSTAKTKRKTTVKEKKKGFFARLFS